MRNKLPTADCQLPIERQFRVVFADSIANRKSPVANGFTLIEITVVVALLSLIVLALMSVFSTTQTAFRASVTQSDVLEGGRAAMDLMTEDLREMAPSYGCSNSLVIPSGNFPPGIYICNSNNPVNFCVTTNYNYPPLIQPLVGGGQSRTNILESFFILSQGNQDGVPSWYGVGYTVITNMPDGTLYPLYRYSTNLPMAIPGSAAIIFNNYETNFLLAPTNWSHLIDGVVDLRIRAYDTNGVWLTNGYAFGQSNTLQNVLFLPPAAGEVGFYMFSNSLPASVEIEMATLEDRALQRAESLSANYLAQSNYLTQQAGRLHVFRQRVSIPNVDPSAYQ